jgi:hypothetical protein
MNIPRNTMKRVLAAAVLVAPSALYASTAANTTVTNTVTVFYQDANAAQNYSEQASAQFAVSLLAAAPSVTASPTAQNTSETTTVEIDYTVTANANGADGYSFDLASAITAGTNVSAATAASYSLVGTGGELAAGVLTLGGTTLAAALATNDTTIEVPWDGEIAGTNTAVNNLIAGDTIVLDGAEYIIDSISNTGADALTNNRSAITLTTAYLGANLPVGTIIGERAVIKLSFDTGSLQNSAVTEDYTVAPEISFSDSGTFTPSDATVTVQRPLVAVSKYVRNSTTASTGSGGSVTVVTPSGTATYYNSGVSGKPGDVMEYLIHVDNTVSTGASKAQNIILSDALPEFTSIDTGTVYLIAATDKDLVSIVAGDWALVDPATSGSAAEILSNTLCVYAGLSGDNSGSNTVIGSPCVGAGGELGPDADAVPVVPAERSLVIFKVSID